MCVDPVNCGGSCTECVNQRLAKSARRTRMMERVARDIDESWRKRYMALHDAVRMFLDEPGGEKSRDDALGMMDVLTRGAPPDLAEVSLDDLD